MLHYLLYVRIVTACCTGTTDENRALNKSAGQISTNLTLVASRAVDGLLDTESCTEYDVHPWWFVDLGASYHVTTVIVTNYNQVADGNCYTDLVHN